MPSMLGHYLFLEAHSFSRATILENIVSTDKYPVIYLCQIHCRGYFLFIIHQIFSPARDWSKHVTWPNVPQLSSRKIACFSEQIMSLDKYPSIFSRQMDTIVYILVSHGKSLLPDPSPKFPQFTPPVFPNLPRAPLPPPPLFPYWPHRSFSGLLNFKLIYTLHTNRRVQ